MTSQQYKMDGGKKKKKKVLYYLKSSITPPNAKTIVVENKFRIQIEGVRYEPMYITDKETIPRREEQSSKIESQKKKNKSPSFPNSLIRTSESQAAEQFKLQRHNKLPLRCPIIHPYFIPKSSNSHSKITTPQPPHPQPSTPQPQPLQPRSPIRPKNRNIHHLLRPHKLAAPQMRPRQHTRQNHRRGRIRHIFERRRLRFRGRGGGVVHIELEDAAALAPLLGETVSDVRRAAEEGGQLDAFVADDEFDDLEAGVVGGGDHGRGRVFEAGDDDVGARGEGEKEGWEEEEVC